MEILKKASLNIDDCRINKQETTVQGVTVDGSLELAFPSPKSKAYTLRSVLFFLQHKNRTFIEYVTLCKNNGVSPISYVDQASILNDIASYEVCTVKGFFIYPTYSSTSSKYVIPSIRNRDLIVLPYSLTARIHMGNVEALLSEGRFVPSSPSPLAKRNATIDIGGVPYEVSCGLSAVQDWARVRAVFVDEIPADGGATLPYVMERCPAGTFYLSLKDIDSSFMKIEISGGRVKNFAEIKSSFV